MNIAPDKLDFCLSSREGIALSGRTTSPDELRAFIATLEALLPFLPELTATSPAQAPD